MAADRSEGDAERGEVVGEEGTFISAACDGDDAAEGGGGAEEREEVGGEAEAGVECQG